MRNKLPLVSVIVPSYNHELFIEQCIVSIINQSYKHFELIVIDDGSTDGSRDILTRLNNKYNFTLVLQENMGCTRTLNKGIRSFAKGKYVTFCASDDCWMPNKLEKQALFMEQNSDVPMCYGKAYSVDEGGNIIQDLTAIKNKNLKGGYIFKDILLMNFHPPVNYFIRKSIFDEVGYYKEDIFTEDFYMNLRISHKHEIGYIDDFISYYRVIRDYTRKPYTLKSSKSHYECIVEYKDSEYYSEAIRKWYFRNFIYYSPYKEHKLYALEGMLKSYCYLFSWTYLKAIARLIVRWK
jgi:alpha-1,3-rhamnosyltransferase